MTSGRSVIEAHLIHLEETLSKINKQVDRQVSNANALSNNLKQLSDKYVSAAHLLASNSFSD